VAPAVGNALYRATGVRIRELPLTPERVWRASQKAPRGERGLPQDEIPASMRLFGEGMTQNDRLK